MKEINQHIALQTKELNIGYCFKKQKTIIAKGINLSLNSGSFTCLLGKNGIGKSTLLRTISNVQPPISGNVHIKGKALEKFTIDELARQLSVVLTEKLPENNLTVFELIALGRQPYTNWLGKLTDSDIEQVKQAMSFTHITHLADKKYYELSDGQLQRVLISRALAQDTDIIILDEPTAHLDVQHKMETFLLLKKLSEKLGKTIIVSTHEIHLAIESSDELWLMTEEKLTCGTPTELIQTKAIDTLFPSSDIIFDATQKRFILNK